MEIIELKAQVRAETGKGKAKQLRANGLLPANLYGHKIKPTVISVDSREFGNLISSQAGSHVILRLLLDESKTGPTVMVKEVQRDSIRDNVLHVDFLSVALDEKITTTVPIAVVGDSIGLKEGGLVQHGLWDLQVEALPTDLPDHIEVDITELNIGDSLHAKDIQMPDELTLVTPLEELVVSVIPPVVYKEEVVEVAEEELEEGEEGEVEAEGEGEGEGEEPSEASEES
ncbi:MAG TPA: 50S ribosomal protein L25 [Actinobacteria bacterium]|nr:50S ribosomal protein L25 [Actinomycetota bacterium]